MYRHPAPASIETLVARAHAVSGRTLASLAAEVGTPVPADLRRAKGWVGQVVEAALGAEGGSRPGPDFESLGVELKTLPVGRHGRPRESTFVCTAPVEGAFDVDWASSHVRRKLACVLWVPVTGAGVDPPGARTIGRARLWSPDPAEEETLRADWQALTELLVEGALHRIHARLGVALQLRPKAAHAADYAWMLDEEGSWVRSVPYGYYLRASFTQRLLHPDVDV